MPDQNNSFLEPRTKEEHIALSELREAINLIIIKAKQNSDITAEAEAEATSLSAEVSEYLAQYRKSLFPDTESEIPDDSQMTIENAPAILDLLRKELYHYTLQLELHYLFGSFEQQRLKEIIHSISKITIYLSRNFPDSISEQHANILKDTKYLKDDVRYTRELISKYIRASKDATATIFHNTRDIMEKFIEKRKNMAASSSASAPADITFDLDESTEYLKILSSKIFGEDDLSEDPFPENKEFIGTRLSQTKTSPPSMQKLFPNGITREDLLLSHPSDGKLTSDANIARKKDRSHNKQKPPTSTGTTKAPKEPNNSYKPNTKLEQRQKEMFQLSGNILEKYNSCLGLRHKVDNALLTDDCKELVILRLKQENQKIDSIQEIKTKMNQIFEKAFKHYLVENRAYYGKQLSTNDQNIKDILKVLFNYPPLNIETQIIDDFFKQIVSINIEDKEIEYPVIFHLLFNDSSFELACKIINQHHKNFTMPNFGAYDIAIGKAIRLIEETNNDSVRIFFAKQFLLNDDFHNLLLAQQSKHPKLKIFLQKNQQSTGSTKDNKLEYQVNYQQNPRFLKKLPEEIIQKNFDFQTIFSRSDALPILTSREIFKCLTQDHVLKNLKKFCQSKIFLRTYGNSIYKIIKDNSTKETAKQWLSLIAKLGDIGMQWLKFFHNQDVNFFDNKNWTDIIEISKEYIISIHDEINITNPSKNISLLNQKVAVLNNLKEISKYIKNNLTHSLDDSKKALGSAQNSLSTCLDNKQSKSNSHMALSMHLKDLEIYREKIRKKRNALLRERYYEITAMIESQKNSTDLVAILPQKQKHIADKIPQLTDKCASNKERQIFLRYLAQLEEVNFLDIQCTGKILDQYMQQREKGMPSCMQQAKNWLLQLHALQEQKRLLQLEGDDGSDNDDELKITYFLKNK